MRQLLRRVVLVVLVLSAVLALGTAGFVLISGYPPFDALYMTLTTVTTIGYGEIRPLGFGGRLFNTFLIVIGVTVQFLAIGALTQTVIELEFSGYFRQRRQRKMIQDLKDHTIVCGYGRIGRRACADLQLAGASLVLIDNDMARVEAAMQTGLLAVCADSTRDETLRDVGIARAKALIATLASDADNLYLVMSAKTMNPKLFVSTRMVEEESEPKLRRAGADLIFSPYTFAGYKLAQSVLQPHVAQFLEVTLTNAEMHVNLGQVLVTLQSGEAPTLQELQVRRELGVIVLAVRKASGRMLFNPEATTTVEDGDHLIVMGEDQKIRRLEKLMSGARA